MSSWCNGPKGLQQILLERGIIDISEVLDGKYSLKGKKLPPTFPGEHEPNFDLSTSLLHLMAECSDFKAEKSILQYIGDEYSVKVIFSPKYHCELAGEGIEYAWGFAKCLYRRIPLIKKKSLANFLKCVNYSLSRELMTKERIRRFSRRARRYISTYYIFHVGENSSCGQVSMELLEK